MASLEIHYRSLIDVARDVEARRVSPVELTEYLLARIEELDPSLRSYATVTRQIARQQALAAEREIAAGKYRGVLHGIPIAVKDLCFTVGAPTSAGMPMHRNFIPDFDATVVARLTTAGAIMLGKLHMTEGAFFDHHPQMPAPINPWGEELWPGVSSSGCGVATAAGLCFASVGSDTGASIRFPAACNALTGCKPTWGRVSRHGYFPLAETFDTIGPIARSAADAAATLSAISGYDPADPTSLTDPVPDFLAELMGIQGARGVRIGIDTRLLRGVSTALADAIESAARDFARIGTILSAIEYPDSTALVSHLAALCAIEMADAHRQTFPSRAHLYGPSLAAELTRARTFEPMQIARGIIERENFRGALNSLLTKVDVVLLPVLSMETPTWDELGALGEDIFNFVRFNMPINAAGAPSVSVPCGFTQTGRPLGMQLVGRHGSEATLLRVSDAYQQITDWHLRRPPL